MTQPPEHCGNQTTTPITKRHTECVLRPGHSGSHADETGMRWWRIQTQIDGTRVPLDELTDDALDQLYAELAEARAEQDRFRTMYDGSEARVNDLIEERDKLDRQLTTMTDVAKGNKAHVQAIVPELEATTARAERAEAAIERVRAIATNMRDWDGDHPAINRWATDIRAALDEQQEQL